MQHVSLRFMRFFALRASVALCLAGVVAYVSAQETGAAFDFSPEQAPPVDSRVIEGKLSNGLAYGIIRTQKPENAISVRFVVKLGSLDETPENLGLAHYLEHMAFNGSTNLAEGELVKLMASHGLSFGAHTNAGTGFEDTSYSFDIVDAKEGAFDDVLFAIREIAGNLTLAPDAIERERGVILAEYARSNTPLMNAQKARFAFGFPGTRIAERFPIGTLEVIRAADRKLLLDLYSRYYRPANAYIAVAGDIDPDAAIARIEKLFADWQPQEGASLTPRKSFAPFKAAPDAGGFFDKNIPAGAMITVTTKEAPARPTIARLRADLERDLAFSIFSKRLSDALLQGKASYSNAGASSNMLFQSLRVTSIFALFPEDALDATLSELSQQLNKARRVGFDAGEVAHAIKEQRSGLEAYLARDATLKASDWASWLAAGWSDPAFVLTPFAFDLAFFDHIKEELTPERLSQVFDATWGADKARIFISGPAPVENLQMRVAQAIQKGEEAVIDQQAPAEVTPFAYAIAENQSPRPYDIKHMQIDDELDILRVTYGNGVVLHISPNDYTEGTIDLRLLIDGGFTSLAPDEPRSLSILGDLPFGGTNKHDAASLRNLLAGKRVDFNVGADWDSFSFASNTNSKDLRRQFELWRAFITDAAYDPVMDRIKTNRLKTYYKSNFFDPTRVLNFVHGPYILHGGDRRFGLDTEAKEQAVTRADLRAMLDPAFAQAYLEINAVGDISPLQAGSIAHHVGEIFGSLEMRAEKPAQRSGGKKVRFACPGRYRLGFASDEADKTLLSFAWPMQGAQDGQKRVLALVLHDILSERITEVIREDLGLTYSPSVRFSHTRELDHFSFFQISILSAPADRALVGKSVNAIIESTKNGLFAPERIVRAMERISARRNVWMQTNGYRHNLLYLWPDRPDYLEEIRLFAARLEKIDAVGLTRLAAEVFDDAKRVEISVEPKPVATFNYDARLHDQARACYEKLPE